MDSHMRINGDKVRALRGGHANGLTAWRIENGKTLKELEAV
jgi:hypothetical protein